MFIIAQCSVDKREMNDEEKLKLKKIIDKMPVEARTTSFGYFPKHSYFKKYLSKESVIALNKFVDYLLGIVDGNNNKELMKCLNMYDSYFEHKSPKQKPESAPKSNGFTMNNFLSEEQINKLKGIK